MVPYKLEVSFRAGLPVADEVADRLDQIMGSQPAVAGERKRVYMLQSTPASKMVGVGEYLREAGIGHRLTLTRA